MRRALLLAAVAVAGCAPLTERVVLLPGQGGAATGALSVKAPKGELLLAEPYAQADVVGGEPQRVKTDAAAVQAAYGRLLEMQPPRPQRFTLRFETGGDKLTADSEPVLDELRRALGSNPAADLVVTGHTDRVGTLEANDRLSLQRAVSVRERLIAAGASPTRISVAGRGEREPAVPTDDEVAEPRNRRVEVRLR